MPDGKLLPASHATMLHVLQAAAQVGCKSKDDGRQEQAACPSTGVRQHMLSVECTQYSLIHVATGQPGLGPAS